MLPADASALYIYMRRATLDKFKDLVPKTNKNGGAKTREVWVKSTFCSTLALE